jgi:peptidoglycan/LPS O-acetylase OafA/YrhL
MNEVSQLRSEECNYPKSGRLVKERTHSQYRPDIDGLRAIAVGAVILFHGGLLANGFVGVDVFFVISGFLITSIVYKEVTSGTFTLRNFYLRRIRRIIPMALFTSLIALVCGLFTMLPDDLENLSQSVIATNFFANNVLQAITTKNYWDIVNEYKPLMHTWSLGVEEQYYLVYPFLFLLFRGRRAHLLLPALVVLSVLSLALYLIPAFPGYKRFYFIQFRFWELAAGGIAALLVANRTNIQLNSKLRGAALPLLCGCLLAPANVLPARILLILTVIFTTVLLVNPPCKPSPISILEYPALVFIGKLSFSMYMWHQVLFAFARYTWLPETRPLHVVVILISTVLFSLGTYYLIEQPFRDRKRINTTRLLAILGSLFVLITSTSALIFQKAGVLRDVPELDLSREDAIRGLHAKYNNRIYQLDRAFQRNSKVKVLVIGDSFARDWANVLLESEYAEHLELSYIYNHNSRDARERAAQADVIFWSNQMTPGRDDVATIPLSPQKLWIVGVKNFGASNGIFYNFRGKDYYRQRTKMEDGYAERNAKSRITWSGRYLDCIAKVIDERGTVPVFTPDRKFISPDCRHLTKAGAKYFATLFRSELQAIFDDVYR